MKKVFYIFIFIFTISLVFLAPVGLFAQNQASTSQQIDLQYKYPWAGATSPADFVSQFYKIALGIAGGAALGVLIYGAILWTVSGAISTKQDAMEWIWAAIWGLVLLLGAYLILNTINPDLIKLQNPTTLLNSANATGDCGFFCGGSSGGGGAGRTSDEVLSESEARQELSSVNIGTKNVCSSGQSTGCVNLGGILQSTLNEVGELSSEIGSENVFVTAGTEGCGTVHAAGTYSHCNGYKVDLRLNTNLNNYITQNFQKISNRTSDGAPQYVSPSGAVYALESNHWDVLVM